MLHWRLSCSIGPRCGVRLKLDCGMNFLPDDDQLTPAQYYDQIAFVHMHADDVMQSIHSSAGPSIWSGGCRRHRLVRSVERLVFWMMCDCSA